MAIKTYRPTTQTLRFRTTLVNDDITSWFRGGGHKRKVRLIDFKRDKTGIPATVASIEYDPNRSARIALLTYADGEKLSLIHI